VAFSNGSEKKFSPAIAFRLLNQNASTKEKSGAGSWRMLRKHSLQQTADVNKF